MKKLLSLYFFSLCVFALQAQQLAPLTVEKIMRDPTWIGDSPDNMHWGEQGRYIYFQWNPDHNKADSLYRFDTEARKISAVSPAQQRALPSFYGEYSPNYQEKVYAKDGDIFLYNEQQEKVMRITETTDREYDPHFLANTQHIVFAKEENLYLWDAAKGTIRQITNFKNGEDPDQKEEHLSGQAQWLQDDQLSQMEVLKQRKDDKEASKAYRKATAEHNLAPVYIGGKRVSNASLSPDERYVVFTLYVNPDGVKNTVVPNYITENAYTQDIESRPNVGSPQGYMEMGVLDTQTGKVQYLDAQKLPGIDKKPDFWKDYPEYKDKKLETRQVLYQGPIWTRDGDHAVVEVRTIDNKDRWIAEVNLKDGTLKTLDHQRDEAWINGPGIGYLYSTPSWGFTPNQQKLWFQSEESGYSHLYTVDLKNDKKKQLTKGDFEIYNPLVSRDEQYFYFTANVDHPGVRHVYRLPINGGKMEQMTHMEGGVDFALNPNGKTLLLRYSEANKPWELYLLDNQPNAEAEQITHSTTKEFESYDWRKPNFITFEARDGAKVHARLYKPAKPNGAAVIFVHGAGYLQNAHRWWSLYFREYMFNNMLTDMGYTVLDMDYRGSSGYGRDWRTGIYRHMGGKDLDDEVDGAHFLVKEYGIDQDRIGMYGGSYGGFMTLMALFTAGDNFACGAALRSVTDWAHYNHIYTSSILNTPEEDPKAYRQSSPIYFADGLNTPLVMLHGVVDTNVHFQDIVRLNQRLIELHKKNWYLAMFPMESHGFIAPSSWTDEYRRILKIFQENLEKK